MLPVHLLGPENEAHPIKFDYISQIGATITTFLVILLQFWGKTGVQPLKITIISYQMHNNRNKISTQLPRQGYAGK